MTTGYTLLQTIWAFDQIEGRLYPDKGDSVPLTVTELPDTEKEAANKIGTFAAKHFQLDGDTFALYLSKKDLTGKEQEKTEQEFCCFPKRIDYAVKETQAFIDFCPPSGQKRIEQVFCDSKKICQIADAYFKSFKEQKLSGYMILTLHYKQVSSKLIKTHYPP